MTSDLPPYGKQWAMQWKAAAPRLQAIRDQELRRLGNNGAGSSHHHVAEGHILYEKFPERHGMVIMQQWLLRRQVIELMKLAPT